MFSRRFPLVISPAAPSVRPFPSAQKDGGDASESSSVNSAGFTLDMGSSDMEMSMKGSSPSSPPHVGYLSPHRSTVSHYCILPFVVKLMYRVDIEGVHGKVFDTWL